MLSKIHRGSSHKRTLFSALCISPKNGTVLKYSVMLFKIIFKKHLLNKNAGSMVDVIKPEENAAELNLRRICFIVLKLYLLPVVTKQS